MYTVYILINKEQQTYVGCSINLGKRLEEHNNIYGKKRGWTRLRGPWELLYREEYSDKREALRREKELKSGKGRDFIKRILAG